MKRSLMALLVALAGSVLSTASGQTAIQIPLLNPGFEEDVLGCGPGCSEVSITGWLCGPSSGTFKPAAAQFPGGVPSGVNVAFVGNAYSTGSIMQVAPVHLSANNTYTLKLSIGHRADYAFTGYFAALMAGNVVLAYDSSLNPAPGTWMEDVIVYKSGNNPPQYDQPITIFIKSLGTGQVEIDDVLLTDVVR